MQGDVAVLKLTGGCGHGCGTILSVCHYVYLVSFYGSGNNLTVVGAHGIGDGHLVAGVRFTFGRTVKRSDSVTLCNNLAVVITVLSVAVTESVRSSNRVGVWWQIRG